VPVVVRVGMLRFWVFTTVLGLSSKGKQGKEAEQ
jgi:hypothetical protein